MRWPQIKVKPAAPRGDVEDNDNDEQVGVCEASPEPFQLFQRHKESLKSGYVQSRTLDSPRIC